MKSICATFITTVVIFHSYIRHFFDDGSVISAQGEFKYWHGKAYAIGAGFIRMNIQRKIYEFKYDDDGTFIRGVLCQ